MAAWLPALKVVLPYVTQIVTTALPVFTSKPEEGRTQDVIPKQISELQVAVTGNAESLKTLAAQLQQTITSIDSGAIKLEERLKLIKRLSTSAIVLSVFAIVFSLICWLH
jgi:hypothetical protein